MASLLGAFIFIYNTTIMALLEIKLIQGQPNEVIDSLLISVGRYIANNKQCKVGITGRHPDNRFAEHIASGIKWERMVVIYKSKSAKNCNTLEYWLVERFFDDLTNQRTGGGSELSEDGYFYVYILLKK